MNVLEAERAIAADASAIACSCSTSAVAAATTSRIDDAAVLFSKACVYELRGRRIGAPEVAVEGACSAASCDNDAEDAGRERED